jgi:hypothetical protein
VIRSLVAAGLFTVGACALLSAGASGQPPADKKTEQKAPAGKYDPPKTVKPDATILKEIAAKTAQLRKALLAAKPNTPVEDAEICLRAAENIVRYDEWFAADSGKKTLRALEIGLDRAAKLAEGKAPWRDVRGKWVVIGFRSAVDDTAQPCAVLVPVKAATQSLPGLDVVLHGRDASLTEVKFITGNDGKAGPKDLDRVEVQVLGRGNNAYRWAGETDVFEATNAARAFPGQLTPGARVGLDNTDWNSVILRGFSMGGAGTWHIGLHHPDRYAVIGPGAGFTTTHGYIGGLPKVLPEYQEKCLHIYDAVDYAENAFNVPVVAYSGEKDGQKAAADNIARALEKFKEPVHFTHLIAPGLEHQMPKEWQEKATREYRKYADKGRHPGPKRIRLVTYTPRYGECDWLKVEALEATYQKAVVDATCEGNTFTITSENVRRLSLHLAPVQGPYPLTIDGQKVVSNAPLVSGRIHLEKVGGKWVSGDGKPESGKVEKLAGLQGPIDDAFSSGFRVVKPVGPGWSPSTSDYTTAAVDNFAQLWGRYFRGTLPTAPATEPTPTSPTGHAPNLVLFGDPQSNPLIAKVLPRLPITWTKDKLIVNGTEYDPKTHVPVLIYPYEGRYVVINSGHTFQEADLKGTNALLYPRLGDWAVIKPTPSVKAPAAYEVVAAGLFDEFWQFPKK